jgi:quinol monooxygenase YgiN
VAHPENLQFNGEQMSELRVTARFDIHAGKFDAFKSSAEACVASVREKDKDTLQYDWFLTEDQSECIVLECYSSSDGLLEHVANLGGLLAELTESADLALEFYGDPSPELMEATASMNTKVFRFFQRK